MWSPWWKVRNRQWDAVKAGQGRGPMAVQAEVRAHADAVKGVGQCPRAAGRGVAVG